MYGQYQTAWDPDAGIATPKRTITLSEKHQDARVPVVRAALAAMLINHDRFAEARAILEETVDKVDAVNTPPLLLGQLYQAYTSALYKTKADKHKTYAAAIKAGDYFAKAGRNDLREHMNDYIDDRKLKPKPRKDKKKRDR
jgi:hypothetical protein